jgi:NADPH:quinone reductase-like Zn-dependent oxidoreductase
MSITSRQLTSTVTEEGILRLSLSEVALTAPGADEIIVRVEAAPINPSDVGLMVGPGDLSTLRSVGSDAWPVLLLDIPEHRKSIVAARIDQPFVVGNEGAGTVIVAGAGCQALLDKRVGMFGGSMFADYRKINAKDVVLLPQDATAADGAAMFVNPLTALGFVETARREGHRAIAHTAAASNLGQMLQKICLKDGIPLVNIVRSRHQEELLRGIGADHVLSSQDEDFRPKLLDAIAETGATIAFDAIGGGRLGSDILATIEQAAIRGTGYSQYGSNTFKQLYIYGRLDPAPTVLNRPAFGSLWSVSGWLLWPMLERFGIDRVTRMRRRVVDELTTTFASHYTRTISLVEALDPEVLRAYERKATREKYLIDSTRG